MFFNSDADKSREFRKKQKKRSRLALNQKGSNLSGGADGGAEDGHQLDNLLVLGNTLVVVPRLKWDRLDHRR